MDLTTAKSEAKKHSQEWGVALSVFEDRQGRTSYLRTNEVPSEYTIIETYLPDGNSEVPKKKNFIERLFNL